MLTGRIDEEPVGSTLFVRLAVLGAALGYSHLYLPAWGWFGWAVVISLDLLWILLLLYLISEVWAQRRQGLWYSSVDAPSFRLGGRLGLRVGAQRGFAGLSAIEVRLRCVDTVMEDREATAQGGQTVIESTQICYAAWEDSKVVDAAQLEGRNEASFVFVLPKAVDLAEPPAGALARHWEVEVVRRGGAAALLHRVLVDP